MGLAALLLAGAGTISAAADAAKWVEGRHYAVVRPAQATNVAPGKVEVLEVFSYGCPACFQFQGTVDKIRAGLPANAQMAFMHASWNASESWPLFQRAYITAQSLGVADKNHAAMFNAVWGENGELSVVDTKTQRLKTRQPTVEDVARFYAKRGGVSEAQFVQAAKSFFVDTRMKQWDAAVKAYQVSGTPTLIVAGKYRLDLSMVGTTQETIDLIKYLVQKETAGR
jgi:thiol:disulfide interchange protein DsbA